MDSLAKDINVDANRNRIAGLIVVAEFTKIEINFRVMSRKAVFMCS
ncbi:hypothetical protein BROSI_A3289 [Candidatus Brocadia sinica JPN1]|uniref:Uncharacterized protein n=1 Tax=Candidatus Brocadia sinica JPN1 TaxID=1197129 RepID=A0ABQ0K1A9_9BACT|nr:hypothetical protein BROSI_A3289 [Candidatus Brocadia sinica JPN1]